MITLRSLTACSLLLVACGGTAPEPAAPPAPSTQAAPATSAAAPSATTPATPPEAPKPAETAPPAASKASAFQIDGTSVSDVTGAQLAAALKKRGWEPMPAAPDTHVGKYEQLSSGGRKDKTNKVLATVTVSRTAKTPAADTSADSDFAPKALQATYANTKNVAQVYDADAEVLVSVMYLKGGSKDDAKKLLDSIVTQPK
jgi:hypothetical protein